MMTKFIFYLFLLASLFTFNDLFAGSMEAGSKLSCRARDLKNKNCYLSLDKNRVQVWKDKIFLNDLVERDTKSIALGDWQFVKAQKISGRWFLEIGLWGPPLGVGEVESLWWQVYEIKNGQYVKHIEKLIQKRKKITDTRFKYDKLANYGLREQKKKIYWHVNYDKGSIE